MKQNFAILTLFGALLMISACSESSPTDVSPIYNPAAGLMPIVTPTPYLTPTPTPVGAAPTTGPGTNWTSGAKVQLEVNDIGAFEDYTGRRLNSPRNFMLNVDLRDIDTSAAQVYTGTLRLAYEEMDSANRPVWYEASFTTGSSQTEAQYNRFYNRAGRELFKGFFEDSVFNYDSWIKGVNYGGIILVVDGVADNDLKLLKGQVYYRNYNRDVCNTQDPWMCNTKSPSKCWFISLGPYDCRDFLVDNKVRPDLVDYPSQYKLLGTFSTMDRAKAFK